MLRGQTTISPPYSGTMSPVNEIGSGNQPLPGFVQGPAFHRTYEYNYHIMNMIKAPRASSRFCAVCLCDNRRNFVKLFLLRLWLWSELICLQANEDFFFSIAACLHAKSLNESNFTKLRPLSQRRTAQSVELALGALIILFIM